MSLESRVNSVVDNAVRSERIVGAVILVWKDGVRAYGGAAGLADRETRKPMTEDTIFRLASVSKPIVSATALALVDEGLLNLDEPITGWLPDFRPKLRSGTTPAITLRQLLSHTSGLGYGELDPGDPYKPAGISAGLDQPGLSLAENLRRLASVPLYFAPGTAWKYGLGIDVAGAVIEKATSTRLGDAVAKYITGPLGLRDTGFTVTDTKRLAAAYAEGAPPNLIGESHEVVGELGRGTLFAPDRIFHPGSYHSGGAGMAGTAPDFIQFLEALRKGGAPILTTATMKDASRNQIGNLAREEKDAGFRFGLISAVLADPAAAKSPQSAGTLEWGGIYGHSWFMDQVAGISVAAFTNTAVEGCLGAFPKEVRAAVYGSGT